MGTAPDPHAVTLHAALPSCLAGVDLIGLGPRTRGKVRDAWRLPPVGEADDEPGLRLLVATDRVSAFDRNLGLIPYRGQVLTQLAAWWFEQLADIVPHHLVDVPDPNVSVVRDAEPLPVEIIVRGHITGVTSTSLWTLYQAGVERPYGLQLPAGLRKNDPLPQPVLTPTTKGEAGAHDERLTSAEVVSRGLVEPRLWQHVEEVALQLFDRGRRLAREAGLVLVDTKYEMGLIDGELALIDEVHTPDSSRYWRLEGLEQAIDAAERPEHVDKEFLRYWFADQGYRGQDDAPPPVMPDALRVAVAGRYIEVFERLTQRPFEPAPLPAAPRVQAAIDAWRVRHAS
jgi:phosphoribosylaminoimidazole-succinocarboxamide synthase